MKTVKYRSDLTAQPRVTVLMKRTVPRCLNGLIRDMVPRGGEVECVQAMHSLPNTTVQVRQSNSRPTATTSLQLNITPLEALLFVAFGSKN